MAVGLDVRGRTLAARGWTRDGGDLYDVLARLDAEGCARYVVTDVNKDGMLQGPNLQLLRDVCAATDRPVVASGGITELDDLEALMELVAERRRGRDRRHRALRGPVHPRGRARAHPPGRRHDASPSASSRASTSTAAGWSRASTSRTCATPATRSSWPRRTTPRAPTS